MPDAFAELSAVIAVGVGISLVMRLIRQPLVIGYILTGVVVGPAVFKIVSSPETIELFANFGIALLLLIVGLGLNPRVIREVGKIALFIAISKILVATSLGFVVAQALGYGKRAAIYIGICLSFSSTIIILKLLSDKKEQSRLYGKISIGFLLVEDLLAALVLIGISSAGTGGFSLNDLWTLSYKIVLILLGLSTIRILLLDRVKNWIGSSNEFLFLFTLGWGLGIASLFRAAGFSLELGALVAGVALAPLPYASEAAARLRPLRDFFIVLFFVLMGSHLQFNQVGAVLPEALLLAGLVMIVNPIIVMSVMGFSGYTKKTSFKTAMTGGQLSEFALILVLLGLSLGQVNSQVVTLVTVTALITIAVSTYLITYSDKLYDFFEGSLHLFERRKLKNEHDGHRNYELVLFGYLKGGAEFLKTFQKMGKSYIVVDYDPKVIDILENISANYMYGDVTDNELLDELNPKHVRLLVSTITNLDINRSLARWLEKESPNAVFVCSAETAEEAAELYELGAAYVMLPHYIGSEKISAFIKKSELKKSEFKKFREKHLAYLESHPEYFGSTSTD